MAGRRKDRSTDNVLADLGFRDAEELTAMLHPDFGVRKTYRGGLCLYPLTAATISLVARLWNSPLVLYWLYRLLNWDFHLRYGRLSYNLMILAERMPAGMVFVRCANGVSHHRDESVRVEDVAAALDAGRQFLDEMARS